MATFKIMQDTLLQVMTEISFGLVSLEALPLYMKPFSKCKMISNVSRLCSLGLASILKIFNTLFLPPLCYFQLTTLRFFQILTLVLLDSDLE